MSEIPSEPAVPTAETGLSDKAASSPGPSSAEMAVNLVSRATRFQKHTLPVLLAVGAVAGTGLVCFYDARSAVVLFLVCVVGLLICVKRARPLMDEVWLVENLQLQIRRGRYTCTFDLSDVDRVDRTLLSPHGHGRLIWLSLSRDTEPGRDILFERDPDVDVLDLLSGLVRACRARADDSAAG
jgi:hypothetical protein